MNKILVALLAGVFLMATQVYAADASCDAKAAEKKLAGAAKNSFIKKCEKDAAAASPNLSFVSEQGRPYEIAPSYDMLPMAFRPSSGGNLPDSLNSASLLPCITTATWRQALDLAETYLTRLRADGRFTEGWQPCMVALARHVEGARQRIARLG